jgi:hypothetical protein
VSYQSTFVRYERREGRVVPVRVTKAWVEPPQAREAAPGKQKVLKGGLARRFMTVRVTELRRVPNDGREQAPEAWTSWGERVESRERVMGLCQKGTEDPVLQEAGYDQYFLPVGTQPLTLRQAEQPMDAEPESREWYLRRQWAESRGYEDEQEAA